MLDPPSGMREAEISRDDSLACSLRVPERFLWASGEKLSRFRDRSHASEYTKRRIT